MLMFNIMNIQILTWVSIFILFLVPFVVNRIVEKSSLDAPRGVKRVVMVVFMIAVGGLFVESTYLLVQGFRDYQNNLSTTVSVPAWVPLAFFAILGMVSLNTLGEAIKEFRKKPRKR